MLIATLFASSALHADWIILDGSALTPGPGVQRVSEGEDSLLELSAPGTDGALATAEFTDLAHDGEALTIGLDLTLTSPGAIRSEISWRDNAEGELTRLRLYRIAAARVDKGVAPVCVRPGKALYEPGEPGTLECTVRSFEDAPTTIEMAATLV